MEQPRIRPATPEDQSDPPRDGSRALAPGVDAALGYALLRLLLGVNFTFHSYTRRLNLEGFANGMVHDFAATPLPAWSVRVFALALPFWEPAVGLLLTLGLWTRWALAAGALLMVLLTFGMALRAEYAALSALLTYALVFFLLQTNIKHNHFSLDSLRSGRGLCSGLLRAEA